MAEFSAPTSHQEIGGWHGDCMIQVVLAPYYAHDLSVCGFIRYANWFATPDIHATAPAPVGVDNVINNQGAAWKVMWPAKWGPAPENTVSFSLSAPLPQGAASKSSANTEESDPRMPLPTRRIAGYGYHPDLPDHRDYRLAPPTTQIPQWTDLTDHCPPVYDQGQFGSCTANAIAAALEFDAIKQDEPTVTPRRLFIYYNERAIEGTTAYDSGAQIRDDIKSVAKLGAPPEDVWPYDPAQLTTEPTQAVYAQASTHVAVEYLRVQPSQIRQALTGGYPVIFGITVFESFEDDTVATTGMVPLPGSDEAAIGGHAMTAVGYDDAEQRFHVRNSWGTGWGAQGYCSLPYTYLLDPNLAGDMWTIRRVS